MGEGGGVGGRRKIKNREKREGRKEEERRRGNMEDKARIVDSDRIKGCRNV